MSIHSSLSVRCILSNVSDDDNDDDDDGDDDDDDDGSGGGYQITS